MLFFFLFTNYVVVLHDKDLARKVHYVPIMTLTTFRSHLLHAIRGALRPAWQTAVWIIKMIVPITLATSILAYLGVIEWVSTQIAPLFGVIGLPGSSGLVFLTAALSNHYAAVAVIATLGFDYRSVVILSVMAVLCHNLIIESVIQHKTGVSAWKMSLLRVVSAFIAAALMNHLLPAHLAGTLFLPEQALPPQSWGEVGIAWLKMTLPLCLLIVAIIMVLHMIQRILQEFRLLDLLSVPLRPFMALFGLPRSTSFLWIICNVVGLTYGGAALIDEIDRGEVTPEDSRLLNTHVALSHSLLEDTAIFYSVGVGLFWLLIPRILLAICAVWILRLILYLTYPYRNMAPG